MLDSVSDWVADLAEARAAGRAGDWVVALAPGLGPAECSATYQRTGTVAWPSGRKWDLGSVRDLDRGWEPDWGWDWDSASEPGWDSDQGWEPDQAVELDSETELGWGQVWAQELCGDLKT